MKKKAIVFVLSDFMGDDYQQTLKITGNKHDLTGIRVYDQREKEIRYFEESFALSGAGVINTRVDESYVKKLLGYFKRRG